MTSPAQVALAHRNDCAARLHLAHLVNRKWHRRRGGDTNVLNELDRPKREYSPPELIEYGNVEQLTLGATGPDMDVSISFNPLTISISGCSTWPGCVSVSS